MKSNNYISCPVSPSRTDENVARTVAFFVIAATLISLLTANYYISLVLALDFAIRTFTRSNLSLLRFLSKKIAEAFHFKQKPIDAAPKKFSAGLGFIFSLLIGLFQIFNLTFTAQATGSILIFCALLEGAAGICLGCIVYSILILPLKNTLVRS